MIRRHVEKKTIEAARRFAEKVYKLRHANIDKFLQGDEFAADVRGFEVEFANCEIFKLPLPEIHEGKEVDKFDCYLAVPNENGLLQALKFDVKTSSDFLINKEQFARKRVDAYLFEEMEFLCWETGAVFLKIYGWILKKDVLKKSELKEFENGSKAYAVSKAALRNPKELFGLSYAGGL